MVARLTMQTLSSLLLHAASLCVAGAELVDSLSNHTIFCCGSVSDRGIVSPTAVLYHFLHNSSPSAFATVSLLLA